MRATLVGLCVVLTRGFVAVKAPSRCDPWSRVASTGDDLEEPSDSVAADDEGAAASAIPEGGAADAAALKSKIFAACAASDRGFAASAADRLAIEGLLDELSPLSPIGDATRGLASGDDDAPLRACWRLVYTSAADVTTLSSNPVASLGGIYQDARGLPEIVNVIDQFPRALANLPPAVASPLATSLRLKVTTRARARSETRVGLTFEAVGAEPLQILGQAPPSWLPKPKVLLPQLGLDLQRRIFGVDDEDVDPRDADTNPSFFDVKYLDDDFLVIQQGSPGGLFAAIKVDALAD